MSDCVCCCFLLFHSSKEAQSVPVLCMAFLRTVNLTLLHHVSDCGTAQPIILRLSKALNLSVSMALLIFHGLCFDRIMNVMKLSWGRSTKIMMLMFSS